MPQPIAVGAVLGGRYRITQHVVTSADQDMVFLGTDQVLNRRVTVLVASRENATQVASSARELATGERNDDVQVLDLGLSEGRTYLIAGGDPDPDVLLGLAYPQELYVEPFQTDSLGSELFGESRTGDPHAYDDEAYYTDLDRRLRADEDEAQRRPGFLNRLSERLAERVRPSDGTAAKAAAGASALAAADAATRKQQEERERAEREAAERAERERKEAEEKARAEREAAERAERERKEAAERAERERREAEERAEEERRAEAERARRQAEQEAEERAAREREAEQARLAAEREEAERRELERRAEARRRAEEERAREAERREAEKREAQEREAAEREAQEREAAEREAQAGTAALPAVAAGAAAAQATDADADGATPPTEPVEPVESVAAEKTDPPEPVAPDTEAIPVRRQRPVPRRAIVAESAPPVHEESRSTAAPVAAGTATGATAAAAGSTSAAAAPDALAAPATTGGDDGATVADPGDGNGRTRGGGPLALLLVLGLLAALVVGGVLLAQNLRGGPAPQAAAASSESASSESASDTPSPSESTSPSPTPTSESAAAAPQPVQALRSVPDLPEHEAEHDADLSNLIDGDPTTVWRTFAYARPNFGGYVESMNLVVQLEERTEVNEVTLQSTGATGGAWFAYIADSPEGANAKEIGNGTFDQDTVSIPVPFEGTEAEAEYVIVSLTSLPQLEGTTSDLPFGLRLGEIAVR
ncbi:hypothetical protein [Micrococcus luteus]|uniref:hypothetical protein n=1 Tax=Micrococcus luteus TaxID=1270 RepID=UPI0011A9E09E|nr:hypothetical protein [Micrococcus luteus]